MFCGIWLIIRRCQERFKISGRLNFRRPLFCPSGFARRFFLCPLFGGLDMGGKKSGGAATPSYEAPNTLNSAQSLRIVDAVCEGEIRGFANGNDAPWKSVFLNDTAVQNADGSFNFKGLAGFFLRGTPDQPYIPGFDVSERTVAVSAEVKKSTPIVRAVTDKLVGRLRVTLGVDRNFQVQGNGDTLAAHTVLRVELVNKDGVRAVESVTFSERAGGVYYQDVLFDQLPEAPFNIRVSRLTDDAASDKTGNKTYFASFVEMIDAKLSYPHTVLAALSVDSDQFGNSVPRRNYLLDGMLVNVPSNYNPDTRAYAGSVWDGSFKKAWTNNPAWVFYDVLTQPRYSTLARRLKAADIDKWTLYQVAKYCDELVDDGFGGKEPRFVCNAYLSDKRQAAELLTDLASVFRGLPVWDGRRFSVVMDADADAVAQYANSNVKDGLFTYSGAAFKSISTAVMVQYVDKYDGYRTKTEYVQDDEAVRRYGLNVRQVAAFGCDSRGQAARFGAWMLQTGLRQQDAVSFTVGREGLRHLPYDVIRIMDNDYAGADFSGRLKAVSGLTVTLDRPVEAGIGSRFSAEANSVLQTLEGMAKPAADRLELSAAPQAAAGDVWVLQGRVKARLYRVVSSKENTADGTFTVSALRHDPQKYGVVDGWAKFDREITTLHNTVPQLMNPSLTAGGGRLTMTWDNLTADGQVLTYDVKIYRNNVLYRHIPDAQTAEIVLENLPNGNYRAEIRGRNARGVLSEPLVKAWSLDYTIAGLKAVPRLQAIQLDWILPQTVVNDVQTEIWYAESNNRDAAKKLTTLPYPQNSYTLSGVAVSDRYWFWLRLVDAAGNSGEWTAAVAGRSDPNPAPIVAQLRGAIEKSSLSQALIDSLDADAASKVAAEAQARVAAIQASAKTAADDLAAKAHELGTKITVVENVNAEQARQIQAVTAAQGNTAAGLEAEKRARAEGDRAEAQARETLAGRVSTAEGNITRETQARVIAINAQAAATEALKTRVGNAESGITSLRETVNQKDSSRASEINQLSAKLNNLSVGGRNLIRDSAAQVQNSNYLIQSYLMTDNSLQEGEPVTVTIWGDLGSDREAFWPFNSNGWNWLGVMKKVSDGVYRIVTTWKRSKNNPSNDRLLIYCGPNTGKTVSRIDRIKLERGTVGTDWSPAPEDEAARREAALTQYQQAQAQKDAALSEEQKTLKAELSGQKARVEQSASALASLDGKVRAMYGLKVEAVSGGRKVIAGLALGADGQTGDSQMLVYADKFAIVDPKSKILKLPFVVQTAGGKTQMALSGDFVADGLIHGRHIAAGQTLSSPSIEGGSLNIGGGQFTVASDGSLVAQNAVVRGRIEGESGYFNGTIKASRIEGDVMKIVRMKKTAEGVWEAVVRTEDLPMMVKPDFEVETVNTDHAYRNRSGGVFSVNGVPQEVVRFNKTRLVDIRFDKANRLFRDVEYTVTTGYGWYVLPRNQEVRLRLNLSNGERLTTPSPCLQTAFLLHTDDEYKKLVGKMVWRKLLDVDRFQSIHPAGGLYRAVYSLPNDIYGLRLKFLTDANTDWENGITWDRGLIQDAIKPYSRDNHSFELRSFERELGQVVQSSAVVLTAQNNWQWMELRDVEVLVPEDRVL
nr:MAG TPA: tail protein [Caudoviricetes sp.]